MTVFLILSIVSCGLSIVSVTWSFIAVRRTAAFSKEGFSFFRLNELREKVDRLCAIEESVIRSVMEEGGEASAEAVLRTTQRLVDMRVVPGTALGQAREIHKR